MLTEAILFLVLVGSLSLLVACVALSPAIVFWFLTKSALWIGFFLALLVAMVAVGGFVGLLLWPVTPIIAMMITVRYRETERRSLLWLLGVAAEKGIPLSTAVRAYADERHDALGRRAAALAEALDRGMPLDAALVASGNRLPTDALVAVRSGCESGGLAPALKDAASTAVRLDSIVRSLAAQAIYVIVYLCFATAVIGYIQYKIVPEFIKIFEGFQLKLPLISVFMVNACYVLVRDPLLAIVMYTGLVALFVFAMAKYMGLVRWDPPLVRRLWRRLDEAVIMRTLAQAVNEGRTLAAQIASLASIYPKAHIRRRLDRACALIDGGSDWCDSLLAAGLLRPADAGVLSVAQRVGNLHWALGEMADRQLRRFAARLTALQAIAFPLILLAVSLVVFVVAAGVFLPLVELISNLT